MDEEGLDNGILWTIKLHVQIEREAFEVGVLELSEQHYPLWARSISYEIHCLEVAIQTCLFNINEEVHA